MSCAAGGIDVIEHNGDGTSLLHAWEGARVVVLVDAVRSNSAPGTIHCVDVRAAGLPGGVTWSSSHALGVAATVKLATQLNCLPHALSIYGIEGQQFGFGTGLSPAVDNAASAVVERLLSSPADVEVKTWRRKATGFGDLIMTSIGLRTTRAAPSRGPG